jgi:hypothetical protein
MPGCLTDKCCPVKANQLYPSRDTSRDKGRAPVLWGAGTHACAVVEQRQYTYSSTLCAWHAAGSMPDCVSWFGAQCHKPTR